VAGSSTATDQVLDEPAVHAAVLEGFVDGEARMFIHPEVAEAADEGTLGEFNFRRSGYLALVSAALAYGDPERAQAALEVFKETLSDRSWLKRVEEARLGDGGMILEGRVPYLSGIPRRIYMWRTGALVLYLNADGSIKTDAANLAKIAEGMQARASG
jgi:hypothetical protein